MSAPDQATGLVERELATVRVGAGPVSVRAGAGPATAPAGVGPAAAPAPAVAGTASARASAQVRGTAPVPGTARGREAVGARATGAVRARAATAAWGQDERRRKIVIPDTAHGTNPASVTMAGYELTNVQTDAGEHRCGGPPDEGRRDHRGADATANVGLFDENIEEISRIFHDARRADVITTASEPERGLRHLAAGRYGLRDRPHQPAQDVLAATRRWRPGGRARSRSPSGWSRSCPFPRSSATTNGYWLDYNRPQSIGKVRGFLLSLRRFRPFPMLHPRLRAGPAGDVGGCRAERELPPGAAPGRI